MDEYVGPSRFQWTSGQMRAANALLGALPEGHRTQRDGQIKRRVVRPSRLSMRLDDPSEAVESSGLMPALRRHFADRKQSSIHGQSPAILWRNAARAAGELG
jgi:hypothetical protein